MTAGSLESSDTTKCCLVPWDALPGLYWAALLGWDQVVDFATEEDISLCPGKILGGLGSMFWVIIHVHHEVLSYQFSEFELQV